MRQLTLAVILLAALAYSQSDSVPLTPGVHLKTAGGTLPIEAELLRWRWSSLSLNGEVVTAPVTAKAAGTQSAIEISVPAEFIVVFPASANKPQVAVVSASVEKDCRNFSLEFKGTNGELKSWAARGKRQPRPEMEELQKDVFLVRLSNLPNGEYAFVLSSFQGTNGFPGDRAFSFRVSTGNIIPDTAAYNPQDPPMKPGVYQIDGGRTNPLPSGLFEWYVPALPGENLGPLGVRLGRLLSGDDPGASDRTRWNKLIHFRTMVAALAQEPEGVIPVVGRGSHLTVNAEEPFFGADYRLVQVTAKDGAHKVQLSALMLNESNWIGFGGGALAPKKEPIPFEASKIGPRIYKISLPELKPGIYGLMSPGSAGPGVTGTLYLFEFR